MRQLRHVLGWKIAAVPHHAIGDAFLPPANFPMPRMMAAQEHGTETPGIFANKRSVDQNNRAHVRPFKRMGNRLHPCAIFGGADFRHRINRQKFVGGRWSTRGIRLMSKLITHRHS